MTMTNDLMYVKKELPSSLTTIRINKKTRKALVLLRCVNIERIKGVDTYDDIIRRLIKKSETK